MTETTTLFPVGTRVRCVKGGTGFPGLLGTVTEYDNPEYIFVEWDNPPADEVNSTGSHHGGSWNEESLQILDNEEVVRLKERIRELELDLGTAQNDVLYLTRLNERKGAIIDENHREVARVKEGRRAERDVLNASLAEARAEREELDSWVRALQLESMELIGRLNRSDEIEEALHARLNELARGLEEVAYERDAIASVLLYAFEHLAADDRQRVFGFWDAVMA